jgi:hypothetical protein
MDTCATSCSTGVSISARPGKSYRLGRRLQHEAAAFIARLRTPAAYVGISSQLAIALRYMRAPRDGQLIHRANGRINCRGSNRRWMKVQWQVTMTFKLAEMLKEVGKSSLMESEVVRSQAQTAAA